MWNLQLYNSTNSTIANAGLAATLPALSPLRTGRPSARPARCPTRPDQRRPARSCRGPSHQPRRGDNPRRRRSPPVRCPHRIPRRRAFTLTGEIPSGTVAQAVTAASPRARCEPHTPARQAVSRRSVARLLPCQPLCVAALHRGWRRCRQAHRVRQRRHSARQTATAKFNFIWLADLVAGVIPW